MSSQCILEEVILEEVCHDLQIFYSIKMFCKISWNFQENKCYSLFVITV